MEKKYMKKEGTLVREDGTKPARKPSPGDFNSDSYSLYFKGLIWEETIGFGVAICREEDDTLLFQMKRSLHDSVITVLEAELIALKRGLTEALNLGINHISIYCDNHQVFELVMERSAPEQENVALIMDDVQRIRQQLTSSIPVLVTGNQAKFAMESMNIRIPPAHKKTSCGSCFNDNIKAEQMFFAFCPHQHCVDCVKQHIERVLLEGTSVPRCPHYGCKLNLNLRSCAHLLTPKIQKIWERRIKQDLIPEWDRFHCLNPSCSAWMSKTKLFESTQVEGVRRCCFKCRRPFCISCKVPWHSNLSCDEYKKSLPKPTTPEWRQCKSCQNMIELLEYRIKITCRCGYTFCYKCGAQWMMLGGCSHNPMLTLIISLFSVYLFLAISLCVLHNT